MTLGFHPTGHAFDRGLTTRGRRAGDRYIVWLGGVLLGYALLSRSFAYVGVPPLFIGEIMIAVGLAALLRAGKLGPVFAQPAAWLMAPLVALAAARTIPYLGEWGLDAVRDFMMFGYAVYAVIVAGLVVARPERLVTVVQKYRTFALVFVGLAWAVYIAYKVGEASIPKLPWTGQAQLIEAKGGDMMVHYCGITVFAVLGMMERRSGFMLLLAASTAVVVASNRGGMLAYVIGCGLAYMMRPPEARVGKLAYAFVLFVALGVLAGPLLTINGSTRTVSVDQVVLNVKSIFGQGGNALDGTKKWRLLWWEKIWDGTVHGPYFWTGRGFGVNLAVADGFDVIKELRSPHNGHMTVLARMGVPGFVLWLAMLGVWTGSLFTEWLRARRAGRHRWMALFGFLVAYMAAIHVNASFDVFLEGPMGGIWFWSLFGFGLAARHIHATRPDVLADADAPLGDDRSLAERTPRRPEAPWGWGDRAGGPLTPGAPPAPTGAGGLVPVYESTDGVAVYRDEAPRADRLDWEWRGSDHA